MRRLISLSLSSIFIGLLLTSTPTRAASVLKAPAPPGCKQYSSSYYGPFDYRTAPQQRRDIVEDHHFTQDVEELRGGADSNVGLDLNYTMGVFPNHLRAIVAMMRYSKQTKQDPTPGATMSLECYFLRGISFVPEDLVFRMQYAVFLISRNRVSDALKIVDEVSAHANDSGFTHFNAGMLYFDMKEYDKAVAEAHRAMALGFDRPDLHDRLSSIGRWIAPAAEAASAAEASASVASP